MALHPNPDSIVDIDFAIRVAENQQQFLRYLLATKRCENNRLQVAATATDAVVVWPLFKDKDLTGKIIHYLQKNGSSVIASVDLSRLLYNGRPYSSKKESLHAFVINGVRPNPQSGDCEFHVRNSWGEGAKLNGWIPRKNFKGAVFKITGLIP
jgi:hypothetical protein